MYTFIDLFCGIGGFRKGLEGKGLQCVFACDINKDIQDTYKKNFGDTPHGDITAIPENHIPQHDILCAGFPCQSFSISGKMDGMTSSNGKLFYEIIRIATHHQPYILLLENVKNILTVNNGSAIKTIDQKLDAIGYTVHRHVLNASLFGVPQARERVYFVCLRKDFNKEYKLQYDKPKESYKKVFLYNILEKEVEDNLYINREDIILDTSIFEKQLKPIRIGQVNKGRQGERIYSSNGHSITLSAFGGGVGAKTGLYYINNKVRRLSINECKALMGFPKDHYIPNGSKGYQQLGNSVIPLMIKNVYESIKAI